MRLRTKKDLEAYIADLEIELAYAERENLDLRAQLAEAIEVIREMSESVSYTHLRAHET